MLTSPCPVLFYLNQRFVGEATIPPFVAGEAPWAFPLSTHYIDPWDGRLWASLEFPGLRWTTLLVPHLLQRHPGSQRQARDLRLDWHFGRKFYTSLECLQVLPLAILEYEFQCAAYNLDNGVN